jgi:hypothetical protein
MYITDNKHVLINCLLTAGFIDTNVLTAHQAHSWWKP